MRSERSEARTPPGVDPQVEFDFGAVFTPIRTTVLRSVDDERLGVSDLLASAAGQIWVVDVMSASLKVYSQDGWPLRTLGRFATGLRRPGSLTALHGRWIAALDGHVPAVVIMDESGQVVRRFPLPELERPLQICNLGDRWLAVVGRGWGSGSGKLVHLYTPDGEHVESLFGEPHDPAAAGRPFVAAAGRAIYLAHSHTDSFAIYDVEACAVLAFPRLSVGLGRRVDEATGFTGKLRGLFATACGSLLALYKPEVDDQDFLYDLYDLSGAPIAAGLRTPERVVGVEGPLYYSVRASRNGDTRLRVWKLRFQPNGTDSAAVPRDGEPICES
ncbi:MAG: hypothetical protein JSU87_15540 [Gemmatimonadota bacterium]|nr:MAG: hypothetical protein JSU87_15540 [Gemmatimonadota bacterium]